ncbi:RNA-guided endonuclease InsQ/TnpB family protein [Anaerotruncus colihominis]|uniref:Transposase, IS605 OrfB family n=1 Tax=Anaerotruncus colihominis DSM 17241 TaxID=445972 RepID=B0PAJ8_9FIRM|nr:RNA-guided endonuclease TnpB family protein [Anaerotruncus colihominis]EDS11178.1 transposase, IS605 OrfB family [Anaerotruncus colihominis DSM 17241]UWN76724.1 transposase [Anaerotruncus colihominis]
MVKTYRYKLYNSKRNRHLDEAINTAASIWNYCIAVHRRYYKLYGKHLSANRLKKHIAKLKRRRFPQWNKLGSQAVQDVVERVDRSYKAFFQHHKQKRRGRKSPPGFKKRRRYSSFTLKQAGYRFHDESNIVTIMGKDYKYWKSRPLEGKIKTVTVKRTPLGEFFIFVVCEKEVNQVLPRAGKAVGYDFGLKHFLTADDGSAIDSPEWYKASLKELRQAHRALSRCQKGSNNRRKALLHLNRVYERISNKRRDWFFKLVNRLVGENAVICLEDLNLDGMKRLWGRKVSDYAFAEFVGILEYAASQAGTTVVKIDRWAPSSKVCHICGGRNDSLSLDTREWDCPQCGAHLDRDVNAAINIKNIGSAMLSA